MPKMKTKSSAKKRLKVLGNGGVKRSMAFKRHILTRKPPRANVNCVVPPWFTLPTWPLFAP